MNGEIMAQRMCRNTEMLFAHIQAVADLG